MQQPKFKVGDTVRVVEGGWGVHTDDIGKTAKISNAFFYPSCEAWRYGLVASLSFHTAVTAAMECSFELVEESVEHLLKLSAFGITITLDPNNKHSRKFADAFLSAVYGQSEEAN